MFYQTLPNIIFIFAVLGIILMILRRLPEAAEISTKPPEEIVPVDQKLSQKGLPTKAISHLKTKIILYSKRMWNFALEAKDLKPGAFAGYRIKRLFREKPVIPTEADLYAHPTVLENRDESFFLELIKREPKNLTHYHTLGKYYLEHEQFTDAKDVYLYLTHHQPTNAEFYAKLASCHFRLKEYAKAAEQYKKSIALDSTQPNRYYNLGLSLEAVNKKAEALIAFEQAAKLEGHSEKYRQAALRLKTKI